MTTLERAMPAMDADESATLAGWLDFYRATLLVKCTGLSDERLREPAAPPSPLTLLGLLRHAAEVERNWFRRVVAQEDAPPLFPDDRGPEGGDGGFTVPADATAADTVATWQAEVDRARANCAARNLDETSPFMGGQVTLRWVYSHLIAEYARHCGHADLLQERLDGTTGF